jgi:uncharacterized protein YbjQ (UPF0145 family)
MLLTTSDAIAGSEIEETLGFVSGATVRTRFIGHDLMAGLKNLVGGSLNEYENLLNDSRRIAVDRMESEARMMGADAVIAMRLATSEITEAAAEVLAYGTAVRIRPRDAETSGATDETEITSPHGREASILADAWVRSKPDPATRDYKARLRAGTSVTVVGGGDVYYRIATADGVHGYVERSAVAGP